MRIVFAGTPEFAVSSLRAAARHHEVVAVYTQPDRPAGRGRGLAPSPVKLEAVARGIPVYQPESLKDEAAQRQLRDLQPDLMVVVAYGLILPKAVLAIPTHGCWNVHASLLPRWRGAAPIQRAIQAGDAKTGVCLMQMEAGLDTGPVLLHQERRSRPPIPAASCMTSWPSLCPGVVRWPGPAARGHQADRAAAAGTGRDVCAQAGQGRSQAGLGAGRRRAGAYRARVQSVADRRGNAGRRTRAHPWRGGTGGRPRPGAGTVLAAGRDGIDIACGQGALRLRVLQREGGKAITAADYLNARRDLRVGA